ncbi:hypothetical protein EJ04DRAFT_487190 [Polyplosphaeria fusca]|uniref:ARID domain-containing protein n=1 Tax=Polyplosphaeria fusca TaxID=682080 RepID=A0A9P4R4I6_9PLEO|nr:hypothetical protein EJ04DRAFT_487190 [Polyplosphaeria fusca]
MEMQNGMYDYVDPSAMMNGTRNQYPMSSIPQKRDSTGATLSRSQTPSQQTQFGLQQGFSHTPSPTMQNQNFRPGAVPPQRMQTMSPAQNPNAQQMSPMGFPGGSPMPPGYRPTSGGQFQVQPVALSQNLQRQQQEAQRAYTMRLQAQQQQLGNLAASNMAAQQRHQAGQMPGFPAQQMGMRGNMNQAHMQQAQAQAQAQAQMFIKNVAALMKQHQRPFNPQPQVAGRPINLNQLYSLVMKLSQSRGFRAVTQTNQWPKVASYLQIDLRQFPTAPDELRMTYEQNLALYEQAYFQRQQQQMQGGNAQQGQMAGMPQQQMSPTRPTMPGPQNSMQQQYLQQLQAKQAMQQQQQPQQQPGQPMSTQQLDHATPVQNNGGMASVNGWSTPQPDGKINAQAVEQHRRSLSRQPGPTPVPSQDSIHPSSPGPDKLKQAGAPDASATTNGVAVAVPAKEQEQYKPPTRTAERWGGIELYSDNFTKLIRDIEHNKPDVPALAEMGVIDIRALTMSIRSALHAEARLALDILTKLSCETQLELEKCEDLVEVLVEYGEELLEILANDNPEVSDILDLTPYEDVIHNCLSEAHSLRDIPEFGSRAYDLDRTADRLIAITTVLRNASFLEINHIGLSSPSVLKFLSNAVRLVGTRILFLRTHLNTSDFMKDVVTFLSNTSTKINLPSRDDAYILLHFLCAFAPCPRPGLPVKFAAYQPQIHRYLPAALDSLAKLLARDDPNRTYYKQIFTNEATATPPYDLLTRAFGLAISVVPDRTAGKLHDVAETRIADVRFVEARIAEARKPYLMQGMLAGDILATLAPGPDTGVCRSWLESEDGWAASLLKFAMSLCANDSNLPPQQHPQHGRNQPRMDHDLQGFHLIVHRALSMLKRLGDKSKGGDPLVKGVQTNGTMGHEMDDDESDDDDMDTLSIGGAVWKVKADVLPKKETLLSALLTPSLDAYSLRQFCSIGYLDNP